MTRFSLPLVRLFLELSSEDRGAPVLRMSEFEYLVSNPETATDFTRLSGIWGSSPNMILLNFSLVQTVGSILLFK